MQTRLDKKNTYFKNTTVQHVQWDAEKLDLHTAVTAGKIGGTGSVATHPGLGVTPCRLQHQTVLLGLSALPLGSHWAPKQAHKSQPAHWLRGNILALNCFNGIRAKALLAITAISGIPSWIHLRQNTNLFLTTLQCISSFKLWKLHLFPRTSV